jgi:hypothetical protein
MGRSIKAYKFGDGVGVERRHFPRFDVHVPLMFDWIDESGLRRQSGGFTRNISERGVFVWCEGDRPPCRTLIGITLLLPRIEPTSKAWRMESVGYVVRIIDDISEDGGFVALWDDLGTEALASGSH